MASADLMHIEVAYAAADDQLLLRIEIAPGSTVEHAIRYSGMLDRFPEIDLTRNKVGVFGKVCRLDRVLEESDRIEIYRGLVADPKSAKKRAKG
jgi:putative ubiquitin-RnfH superfamily antitoxin RatB of RatAB toxin-antitoxin module